MLVLPADLVAVAKATITECTVGDVETCLNSDTLIIDIREPAEFIKGHIPGALLLPRGLLEFQIHDVVAKLCAGQTTGNENQPIVLYCGTGGRSTLAAQSLQSMGYKNVKSMSGGIIAWTAAQLPVDYPT